MRPGGRIRVWLHFLVLLIARAVAEESDDVQDDDGRSRLLEELRDRDYLVRFHGFRPEGASAGTYLCSGASDGIAAPRVCFLSYRTCMPGGEELLLSRTAATAEQRTPAQISHW